MVGREKHSEVGRDIIIENAFSDDDLSYKESVSLDLSMGRGPHQSVYRILGNQGYVRILFLHYKKPAVAFGTDRHKANPSLVVEAMRDLPEHEIMVQDKTYKNLEDFKARNGMMSTDTGVSDSLRSALETPELMQAPDVKEEESFSAYASITMWLKKNCIFTRSR
jgi:hypothetical protein